MFDPAQPKVIESEDPADRRADIAAQLDQLAGKIAIRRLDRGIQMIERLARRGAERPEKMRGQAKRQHDLRLEVQSDPVAAFAPHVVHAFGAPAKFERKAAEKTAAPKSELGGALQRAAIGLDEILIEIPFALEKCVAPVLEHAEA